MADGLALEGPAQQEFSQGTVQVWLKLQHLHQLKQVHVQLVVTAVHKGKEVIVTLGHSGGIADLSTSRHMTAKFLTVMSAY